MTYIHILNRTLMMKRELKIAGMTCQHCVQTVSETVAKVAGVKKVEVDFDQEKVTVEFDESQAQLEDISNQIIDAGFEVFEN